MSLASLLLLNIDVQMNLMIGDIPHLLDVIWSWISPSEDGKNVFRPHGDPQMIRFGAHLVLVLRYLLVEQMKGAFKEKIMTVGDLILHINILFREFALISMWRVPAMPIGAHTLLSFLAEPLKQPTKTLLSTEDHDVSVNLREFQDWSEYYSCDATYRNWLKVELENVEVSPLELSVEEKQRAIAAAEETLNSSFSLLLRKENPWLVPTEDRIYESVEPLFLELHAIAMLMLLR
ncbi:Nuclear pore complex protein NUP107 [Camellia lanceoleosa]|uniref:Nuclear pore complex protein NUP107 n=1 Tax=Camellia lanceoleosa TaxID=1840588 RepID=A0ACC0IRU8_9ERIC|nr:Nuclear pore complex protein NUP107 [Camellia lanceoleosa]